MELIDKASVIAIIQDMHGLARADVISNAVNQVIAMSTIDAVPVGCLELEKRDASFADACDMGSAYSRERERACKNIIEWWESPSYERCLEVATQRGFVQKKWK